MHKPQNSISLPTPPPMASHTQALLADQIVLHLRGGENVPQPPRIPDFPPRVLAYRFSSYKVDTSAISERENEEGGNGFNDVIS